MRVWGIPSTILSLTYLSKASTCWAIVPEYTFKMFRDIPAFHLDSVFWQRREGVGVLQPEVSAFWVRKHVLLGVSLGWSVSWGNCDPQNLVVWHLVHGALGDVNTSPPPLPHQISNPCEPSLLLLPHSEAHQVPPFPEVATVFLLHLEGRLTNDTFPLFIPNF